VCEEENCGIKFEERVERNDNIIKKLDIDYLFKKT
jgi:hypothetical protein